MDPDTPSGFDDGTRDTGTLFFIDEVFVKIQGKQLYLWRAVDQDGEVVDVFLQNRTDGKAVVTFSSDCSG